MKRFLLVLALLFSYCVSGAQQTLLKGVVMDSMAKRPLEGVTLVQLPTNTMTVTDENGSYHHLSHGWDGQSIK